MHDVLCHVMSLTVEMSIQKNIILVWSNDNLTFQEEGRAVIGSLVHARLEELQREVLLVQREQSILASQRAELAREKQRLAEAVASAEQEKQCLEGERRALQRPVARRAQSKQQETIEQLSKQVRSRATACLCFLRDSVNL